MNATKSESKEIYRDTKKVFRKLGTCSRTFFYILNREFGYSKETEERAADPLAGGIMRKGYQCGMLWGASLAVGSEAYRRFEDKNQAIGVAIIATQHIMNSFEERENTVNCRAITRCDFSSKLSFAKYFLSGRFLYCFKMAEKWAPAAIQSAMDGLAYKSTSLPSQSISCCSELVKKMGASDEETVMVAGFAGGLGLSGNACGALSAAIWINTLDWCREISKKSSYNNPNAEKTFKAFQDLADDKILCNVITGQDFESIKEHTKFIKNGGCEKLINGLALSKSVVHH